MRILKIFLIVSLIVANMASASAACCFDNLSANDTPVNSSQNFAFDESALSDHSTASMPCHQSSDDPTDVSSSVDNCKCQSCSHFSHIQSTVTTRYFYSHQFTSHLPIAPKSILPETIYHPPKFI